MYKHTFKLLIQNRLSNAPTSTFFRLTKTYHAEYNRAGTQPTTPGCFAPAGPERTIIVIYTDSRVYAIWHTAIIIPDPLDMATGAVFGSNVGEQITAVAVFGECFGNFGKLSQQLWLAVGMKVAAGSVLRHVALSEFADSSVTCTGSTWDNPAGGMKAVGSATCVLRTRCAMNQAGKLNGGSATCEARITSQDLPLSADARDIQARLLTHNNPSSAATDLDSAFITHVFVIGRKHFEVYSFQEIACSTTGAPRIEKYTSQTVPEQIVSASVSANSQHLFLALFKREWELLNQQRLVEICAQIRSDPFAFSTYLKQFQTICQTKTPSNFTVYDYIRYYSSCATKYHCPFFGNVKTGGADLTLSYASIAPGTHVIRPLKLYDCERGFYCPAVGDARRIRCPSGFVCPNVRMAAPLVCTGSPDFNSGCISTGLATNEICPPGFICMDPLNPVPAPPGFLVRNRNRRMLVQCGLGQYCPLAATNETAASTFFNNFCPQSTYCSSPANLVPINCTSSVDAQGRKTNNATLYCAAGTFEAYLCPAGFECPTPTEIKKCLDGFFCPAGTQNPEPCPKGFYCPTPESSLMCPAGSYCTQGTTNPVRCPLLVICTPGTTRPYYAFGVVIVDVALLIVALIGFVIVRCIQRDVRKKKDKKRKEQGKAKVLSETGGLGIGTNIALASGVLEMEPMLNSETAMVYALDKKKYTMDFELQDLSYVRKKNNKVTFAALNGKIRACKTTCIIADDQGIALALLSTLAGRAFDGYVDGKVLVNGAEEKDLAKFKNVTGYVPEEAIMHTEFKVKELLRFAAHQRLPSNTTFSQVSRKVNQILNVFNLNDFADHTVGKLKKFGFDSVQRKLVNIAMEVVAEPNTLFLELPFSGLDTDNAKRVMRVLKDVADSNVTVIAAVSRPAYEIFKMFDECVVISEKAGVVYNGPTTACLSYFDEIGFRIPTHVNPVDFFVDILQGNVSRPGDLTFKPEKLNHYWDIKKQEVNKPWSRERGENSTGSDEYSDYVAPNVMDPQNQFNSSEKNRERNRKNLGMLGQYFLITIRSLLEQIYHIKGLIFDFLFTFIIASIVGVFFVNTEYLGPLSPALQAKCPPFIASQCSLPRVDTVGGLMVVTSGAIAIAAAYTSIKPFSMYKNVFKREVTHGINKFSYFLGKLTSHIPYLFFLPFIFLSCWYVLVSPRTEMYIWYGIFVLLWFTWSGVGFWASVQFQRIHIMFVTTMAVICCCIVSGYQPKLRILKEQTYTEIIVSFSPIRWSLELMYLLELRPYESDGMDTDSAIKDFGFSKGNIGAAVGILVAYGIVFRLLAFLALYFSDPNTKEFLRTILRVFIRAGKEKLKKLKDKRKKSKRSFKDPTGKVDSKPLLQDDVQDFTEDNSAQPLMQEQPAATDYQPPAMQ